MMEYDTLVEKKDYKKNNKI